MVFPKGEQARGVRKGTRAGGREKGGSIRNEKLGDHNRMRGVAIQDGFRRPESVAENKKAHKNFGTSCNGQQDIFLFLDPPEYIRSRFSIRFSRSAF